MRKNNLTAKFIFYILIILTGCKGDDGGILEGDPPRLLSEVAVENEAEILDFLQTHYYNYEDFQNPPENFDNEIIIKPIGLQDSDKTPLIEQVNTIDILVSNQEFSLEVEEEVNHRMYYIIAKNGNDISPYVADSTLIRYKGLNFDLESFDQSLNFNWIELSGFIRGVANGISKLKGSKEFSDLGDGNVDFPNSGVGIIFIPSGLGYFNSNQAALAGLNRYEPAIFSIELGRVVENTDSDNDGIPNRFEDLNNNNNPFDENTDEQTEKERGLPIGIANFRDLDDDGDGVPTREEISNPDGTLAVQFPTAENPNIVPVFPDDDNNGIPDYLDGDYLREVFNDN